MSNFDIDYFEAHLVGDPINLRNYLHVINGIRYIHLIVFTAELNACFVRGKARQTLTRFLGSLYDGSTTAQVADSSVFTEKRGKFAKVDCVRFDGFITAMLLLPKSKLPFSGKRNAWLKHWFGHGLPAPLMSRDDKEFPHNDVNSRFQSLQPTPSPPQNAQLNGSSTTTPRLPRPHLPVVTPTRPHLGAPPVYLHPHISHLPVPSFATPPRHASVVTPHNFMPLVTPPRHPHSSIPLVHPPNAAGLALTQISGPVVAQPAARAQLFATPAQPSTTPAPVRTRTRKPRAIRPRTSDSAASTPGSAENKKRGPYPNTRMLRCKDYVKNTTKLGAMTTFVNLMATYSDEDKKMMLEEFFRLIICNSLLMHAGEAFFRARQRVFTNVSVEYQQTQDMFNLMTVVLFGSPAKTLVVVRRIVRRFLPGLIPRAPKIRGFANILRMYFILQWKLKNTETGMRVSLVRAVIWVACNCYNIPLDELSGLRVDVWGDGVKRGNTPITRYCFRLLGYRDVSFPNQSRSVSFCFAVMVGKDCVTTLEMNLESGEHVGDPTWLYEETQILADQGVSFIHNLFISDHPFVSMSVDSALMIHSWSD